MHRTHGHAMHQRIARSAVKSHLPAAHMQALCGSPIFKLLGAIVRCVSPLCQRKPKGKGKAANLGVSNKFSHTANGWVLEGQEVQPAAAPLHGPPTVLPGRPSHGQVDAPSAQRDSSGSITMSHDAGCHSWKRGKSIKDRYVNTPGIHSSVPGEGVRVSV